MTEEKQEQPDEPEMINGLPVIHATLNVTEMLDGIGKRPREGDSPQPEEPDKESK